MPGSLEWDHRADAVGRALRLIRDGVVEREPDRRGVTAEQRWRPWRSYAGLHLWRSATTPERITP